MLDPTDSPMEQWKVDLCLSEVCEGDVERVGHQADSGRGMLRGKGEEEEVAR